VHVIHVGSLKTESDNIMMHLDSHAEQCVVGANALIFQDFERPVDVCGYDPRGPVAKSLQTVSAAVAYTKPFSGQVVILVIHQAIHAPFLSHNLLCPNQLRLNDVAVDEQPKFLTEGVTEMTHAIGRPADQQEGLPAMTIPLELLGLISVFDTSKPTEEEFEQCERYELTSQDMIFDPYNPSFAQQEAVFTDFHGQLLPTGDRVEPLCIYQVVSSYHEQEDESDQVIARSLYCDLEGTVWIPLVSTQQSAPALIAEKLAANKGTGLERAEKTLQVTTQRGVCTVLPAYLLRQFRTND
jgi:hypothetical protein